MDGDGKQLGVEGEGADYARARDQLEIRLEMGWSLAANATGAVHAPGQSRPVGVGRKQCHG